jgi:aarF domain-containing kinase
LKGQDGHPGDWAAGVKVQKPAVAILLAKEMEPDLAAFRAVIWIYDSYEHWVFDMPTYFFLGKFVSQENTKYCTLSR